MESIMINQRQLNSLSVAIDVLNYIAMNPNLTLSQISSGTDLTVSQTNRILTTLHHKRMILKSEDKRFILGYAVLHLGETAKAHFPLRHLAVPVLEELRDITNESSHLVLRDGDYCVIGDVRESHQSVRVVSNLGKRGYLHVGGSGKVFLANSSKAYIDQYLSRPLKVEGPATLTDPEAIRQELRKVLERGYCVALEDYESEAFSVAAPVYDQEKNVVACVAVGGPLARWNTRQCDIYVDACLAAANKLSRSIASG